MITPSQGAERTQLGKWATPRLLRYFKSRRKSKIIYFNRFVCECCNQFHSGDMTENEKHTLRAMEAELDFIQNILKTRAHVKK